MPTYVLYSYYVQWNFDCAVSEFSTGPCLQLYASIYLLIQLFFYLIRDEMNSSSWTGNCCCCWAMSWSNPSRTFYPRQAYPSKAGKDSGAESYSIRIMEALNHLMNALWSQSVHKMLANIPNIVYRKHQSHDNLLCKCWDEMPSNFPTPESVCVAGN